MFKGKWKHIQIDLVEEIANATIHNKNFDVNKWSEYDADVLSDAAAMIRRELIFRKRNTK